MKNRGNPLIKIYQPLLLLLLILAGGVIGYSSIEDYSFTEALYMTAITVSTVGFKEVRDLSDEGRLFTIALIISTFGVITYLATTIARYFLDGEFRRDLKIFRMKNKINQLKGHVILCGLGRNGRSAARALISQNVDFVVVENRKERIENCGFELKYYLEADATKDESLIEADIAQAKALITTMPDDADNVYTVLTARELNPNIRIISRASNDASVKKLKTAGANNIIMPDKLGGAHMATLVINPDITEFMDIISTKSGRDFMIKEFDVKRSFLLKKMDCWERTGATILGIKKPDRDYILNPQPELTVQEGWRLIVMGSEEQFSRLNAMLDGV